jgi:hypothetical protein
LLEYCFILILASDEKFKQFSDLLQQKDLQIKQFDNLINEKDQLIKYLQSQLTQFNKEKNEEMNKIMEEQKKLKNLDFEVKDSDEYSIAQEFFIRFSSFLFKKKLTLSKIIHHKIFDKVINGVEMELITVDHFWRLINKAGFRTVISERNAVTALTKNKVLNNIFEVKVIRKILAKLGVLEDIPKSTKNFNYEELSGSSIRIINKILREMKEKKMSNLSQFLGSENIENVKMESENKTETVQTISADNFINVLRKHGIMKRWEDLDENLQIFLSMSYSKSIAQKDYSGETLILKKLDK